MDHTDRIDLRQRGNLATTQWSVVLAAGNDNSRESREALESLCATYWPAVYQYVLRRESNVETARDLTQSFFAFLLEKHAIARAKRERGKFRSYLLTTLKHFLVNEREYQAAKKRGGGVQELCLDFQSSESKFSLEPFHEVTPDKVFERRWVAMLLDQVLSRLKSELIGTGKAAQFDLFKTGLTGELTSDDYAQAADELGISPAAAKQAAYRMRKRYGTLFREEVARTLENDADIEQEVARLIDILAD